MTSRAEIQALIDENARDAALGRQIFDQPKAENRDLNSEEEAKHDRILDAIADRKKRIHRMERQLAVEEDLEADTEPAARQTTPDPINKIASAIEEHGFDKLTPAAKAYIEELGFSPEAAGGVQRLEEIFVEAAADIGLNPWSRREALAASQEYESAFLRTVANKGFMDPSDQALISETAIKPEQQATLQSDLDTRGGYLTTPTQWVGGIIQEMDKQVTLRGKFTNMTVRGADSLGLRKRTGKASTYTRGPELGAPTPDESLEFGGKVLTPHYWTAEIYLSRDLLRRSVVPIRQYAARELVRDIRENKNLEYVGADGAQRPLGIFVASDDGISTSQDVVGEGFTTNALSFEGLYDVKYAAYRYWSSGLEWGFHPDWHKSIAKIFDNDGRPIWQDSVRVGEPDRLLGIPVFMDEDLPNTVAAGQYAGALADWSNYVTATSLDMETQVFVELRGRQNQIILLMRGKDDGLPILEEPFYRIQLAAS